MSTAQQVIWINTFDPVSTHIGITLCTILIRMSIVFELVTGLFSCLRLYLKILIANTNISIMYEIKSLSDSGANFKALIRICIKSVVSGYYVAKWRRILSSICKTIAF